MDEIDGIEPLRSSTGRNRSDDPADELIGDRNEVRM